MLTVPFRNEVERLVQLENRLGFEAAKANLRLRRSRPYVYGHLSQLSSEALSNISDNLGYLHYSLAHCWENEISPWDDREFFRISMKAMGLTYPKDFIDNVGPGDLIEGYDMNRLQVFRNMRFMEVSGYSLLEILSFEWTVLYDRPRTITDKMISLCDEILWKANRTIPFAVPPHYIRELQSSDQHVYQIEFKYLTPLFSGPDQPYGMLGNSGIEVLRVAKSRDNLSFI